MSTQKERKRFLAGPQCPQILKVSKNLNGRLSLSPGEPCKCECRIGRKRQTIFQVNYRSVLTFDTAKPCDETDLEPLLRSRSTELWLDGRLTLRDDVCPDGETRVLIGRNQGRYQIRRPNENVMVGHFCGTEGVLPTAEKERRCCAPAQGVGSICGDGIGKLTGWSLCGSYHSFMPLDPSILCEQISIEYEMKLDGVLIGPCQAITRKR